jgi:hypothetical protein
MQTQYDLNPGIARAGQLTHLQNHTVDSYKCSEAIPAGRICELHTDGLLRLPQGTTLGKVAGISMYENSMSPGGYKSGDLVPVLRSGRIYVDFTGGTQTALAPANVMHATDDSLSNVVHRGKFTALAIAEDPVDDVGAEIGAAGESIMFHSVCSDPTLAIVTVLLP